MVTKVILNVLYNLAILTFALCLFWGIKHENYLLAVVFIAGIALIGYFKWRLIKQVKELAKKRR